MLNTNNLFVLGYWSSIVMSSIAQPLAWKRYIRSCASLGYQPEATVETNLLQRYQTLYTRYCQDNGLQFDPSTNLDSDVDMQKLSKVLLLNLCEKLGCESIIQIRRNRIRSTINYIMTNSIMLEVRLKDLRYLHLMLIIDCFHRQCGNK
jgi:hypothetical protein